MSSEKPTSTHFPTLEIHQRKRGERALVTLNGVKVLSRPILEIRQIKGIKTPHHFGDNKFKVETSDGRIFTIHINAYTREQDTKLVNSLPDDGTFNLVLNPQDWVVGEQAGTAYFLVGIKEG